MASLIFCRASSWVSRSRSATSRPHGTGHAFKWWRYSLFNPKTRSRGGPLPIYLP